MSGGRHWEQDKDSTVYVGNLDERCHDALIWEVMIQAGPVVNVHLPKDRVTQTHQGYGFVEFVGEQDADYAVKIMNGIRMYGKPIRVNKASADRRGAGGGSAVDGQGLGGGTGVGAELFVGNLDQMVDEKVLFDTFSRFGPLIAPPKIARDDNNVSKGYGFISYSAFEHADDAITNMHGQYLMNREATVQYAYKKDGKGERHGDEAERALAAEARKNGVEISIPAMPASLVMPAGTPSGPSAMANGYGPGAPAANGPRNTGPLPPAVYAYGAPPGFQPGFSPGMMPPPNAMPMNRPSPGGVPGAPAGFGAPPQRNYNQSPLPAAPAGAGLPARPPPSTAGYRGPPGVMPGMPGMPGLPPMPGMPGMPPMPPPPAGFPGMPAGFRPPGPPPNGFPPHQQR